MADRHNRFITALLAAAILLTIPATSHAENWQKFSDVNLELPGKDHVVKGFSESYYDADSVKRFDGTKVQVWLKENAFLGDLEPHVYRELLRIDCANNSFQSLVEKGDIPGELEEINRGTIGAESTYRIIREMFCGY